MIVVGEVHGDEQEVALDAMELLLDILAAMNAESAAVRYKWLLSWQRWCRSKCFFGASVMATRDVRWRKITVLVCPQ
jgi:hypothetical protein